MVSRFIQASLLPYFHFLFRVALFSPVNDHILEALCLEVMFEFIGTFFSLLLPSFKFIGLHTKCLVNIHVALSNVTGL